MKNDIGISMRTFAAVFVVAATLLMNLAWGAQSAAPAEPTPPAPEVIEAQPDAVKGAEPMLVPTIQSSSQVPVPGTARISHYWPPLGGTNCSNFVNGKCISRTASGQRWEDWVGRGLACPKEFPFGTRFIIDSQEWVCVDRGGAIKFLPDWTFWLDLLVEHPLYKYGTVVAVYIIQP